MGPDAERAAEGRATRITLQPGGSAVARLHWAADAAGPCRPAGSLLRVYPPGASDAAVIPAEIRLCGDVFTVGPVTG